MWQLPQSCHNWLFCLDEYELENVEDFSKTQQNECDSLSIWSISPRKCGKRCQKPA